MLIQSLKERLSYTSVLVFLTALIPNSSPANDVDKPFENRELLAIYRSNIDKIAEFRHDSLLSKFAYGMLLRRPVSKSASDCSSTYTDYLLSCIQTITASYSNRLNYYRAYRTLHSLRKTEIFNKLGEPLKKSILGQMELYKIASEQSYSRMDDLGLTGFTLSAKVDGKTRAFLIDTGARVSSLLSGNELNKKFEVISATGLSLAVEPIQKDILHIESLLFIKSKQHNILGLNFLKTYNKLTFKRERPKRLLNTRLFEDSSNIFIRGGVVVEDHRYRNLNLCIDTGSKVTIVMPKGYRRLRSELKSIDPKKLSLNSFGGKEFHLGKIINSLSLRLGNLHYDLSNVPALFKNKSSTGCDVVLGVDFLSQHLYQIDWESSTVTLSVK